LTLKVIREFIVEKKEGLGTRLNFCPGCCGGRKKTVFLDGHVSGGSLLPLLDPPFLTDAVMFPAP
jgi:hypothetical protein